MKLNFRTLRADEVDVRVATVKDEPNKKGVQLLLYKDARCDMNILDETVGAANWQRSHLRDNANCVVSIWDEEKKQWISKEDTGTESSTEREKGLASDSFKRACVNWGIGRELYTAPFIWVSAPAVDVSNRKTYDRFSVSEMTVIDGKIKHLVIWNDTKKCQAYPQKKPDQAPANEDVADKHQQQAQKTTPVNESTVNPPRCADCGAEFKSADTRTVQELAKASKEKFKRPLCVECARKELARRKSQQHA